MMTTPQDTDDLADLNAIMERLPEEAAHTACEIAITARDGLGRIASIEVTSEENHHEA